MWADCVPVASPARPRGGAGALPACTVHSSPKCILVLIRHGVRIVVRVPDPAGRALLAERLARPGASALH